MSTTESPQKTQPIILRRLAQRKREESERTADPKRTRPGSARPRSPARPSAPLPTACNIIPNNLSKGDWERRALWKMRQNLERDSPAIALEAFNAKLSQITRELRDSEEFQNAGLGNRKNMIPLIFMMLDLFGITLLGRERGSTRNGIATLSDLMALQAKGELGFGVTMIDEYLMAEILAVIRDSRGMFRHVALNRGLSVFYPDGPYSFGDATELKECFSRQPQPHSMTPAIAFGMQNVTAKLVLAASAQIFRDPTGSFNQPRATMRLPSDQTPWIEPFQMGGRLADACAEFGDACLMDERTLASLHGGVVPEDKLPLFAFLHAKTDAAADHMFQRGLIRNKRNMTPLMIKAPEDMMTLQTSIVVQINLQEAVKTMSFFRDGHGSLMTLGAVQPSGDFGICPSILSAPRKHTRFDEQQKQQRRGR